MAALMLCTGPGFAAGLSFADNQVFPHGYVDFGRSGPLALTDYPYAAVGSTISFQTSYRSLYNMKELTDSRAALAYSRRGWTTGFGAATFGKPDYFHQMGLAAFGSYRFRHVAGGVSITYHRLSFNREYDALSLTTITVGAAYVRGRATVYAVSRAVNQPRYHDGGQAVMPEVEAGMSYKSGEGLDSQVKALFVRRQKPTAEISQAFRLSDFARISWALVLLPARFGGGICLEKGHVAFEYKISHHPVLGATHTVLLLVSKG
jgi:hypothetical protein